MRIRRSSFFSLVLRVRQARCASAREFLDSPESTNPLSSEIAKARERMLTPHPDGMRTRISNSRRVHALPSRDFRISLRRVRIPGANEERSGTLAATRRKKKEAPRPRYVAGTQTGVLVPTSLCIHLCASERERVLVYFACASTPCSFPPFPPRSPLFPSLGSPLTPADPPRVSRVHRRHERYHVLKLKPRREKEMRGLTSILTAPPSPPSRRSFSLAHLRPKEKRKRRRRRRMGRASGEMRGEIAGRERRGCRSAAR